MDPTPAPSPFGYRTAGLASRNQKDLAVEIIEAEIRSAQHEVLHGLTSPSARPPNGSRMPLQVQAATDVLQA